MFVISHLLSPKFDLEILCGLLSDSSTKVQLVYLTIFIPHRCLIMHNELSSLWNNLIITTATIRFDFPSLQLKNVNKKRNCLKLQLGNNNFRTFCLNCDFWNVSRSL